MNNRCPVKGQRFFIAEREVHFLKVKINREIRNYTESMFFGLSMRQFIFSVLACGVAVGLYFFLRPYVGISFLFIANQHPLVSLQMLFLPNLM